MHALKMMMDIQAARCSVVSVLLCAAWLTPQPTHAASCPVPAGAAANLVEHSVEARLRFVRESLRETARQERRFAVVWGLTYVGLSAGSWVLMAFSDDPQKLPETAFNSATSLGGAGLAILQPLLTIRQHHRLEKLLAAPVPSEPCAVLAAAERHLTEAAKLEDGAKSPRAHLINIGVSLGLGLFMAYGLKRPNSAPLNTAMGLLLGEAGIFTRPTYASRSLARYREGVLEAPRPPYQLFVMPAVQLTSSEYSVALAGSF